MCEGSALPLGPTRLELVEALQERLDQQAERPLGPFESRIADNVTAIIDREDRLGAEVESTHQERLSSLGATSDSELAEMIRSGALDDRWNELRGELLEAAADRLAINNPRWVTGSGQ